MADLLSCRPSLTFSIVQCLCCIIVNPPLVLQAILESEPFGISIKDAADAKKLGEDFAKELGKCTAWWMHPCLLMWSSCLPFHCYFFKAVLRMTRLASGERQVISLWHRISTL